MAGKYRLDIGAQRRRHADPEKYMVYVLWLIGYSQRSIAITLQLRTKQVAGIIDRSDYRNRAIMTDQERRSLLYELKEVRYEDGIPLDGGRLDRIEWELLPLGATQMRGPLRRKTR
jgi:hypothetical protein